MISHHTDLLNALITKHNLSSYLEIGVQEPANNFNKIKCPEKYGVDPEVICKGVYKGCSDSYFENPHNQKWDLIFIDGLHHADQVKRDFENSLKYLSNNGFILIHDCLPENENTTHVPRDSKIWHGDVYKFVMTLRNYPGINFLTFNIDNGCCLVWKDERKTGLSENSQFKMEEVTFHFYQMNKALMHITDEVIL